MKDSKVLPFIQGDVKCKTCAPVQIIGTMAVLGVIAVGLGLGLGSGLQSDDDPSPAPVCVHLRGRHCRKRSCMHDHWQRMRHLRRQAKDFRERQILRSLHHSQRNFLLRQLHGRIMQRRLTTKWRQHRLFRKRRC